MLSLQILVLMLQIKTAGIICSTDFQCELAEQAYSELAKGQIHEASLTIDLFKLEMMEE